MTKLHLIRVSLRSLRQSIKYNFLKTIGIISAFTICIIAIIYINDERSFDSFYANKDRIYRVNTEIKIDGIQRYTAKTNDVVGKTFQSSLPQVQLQTRVFVNRNRFLVKKEGIYLEEESAAYVDSTFFRLFEIKAVDFISDRLFEDRNSIVITKSIANKYFGNSRAVGKQMELDRCIYEEKAKNTYTVAAVIEDFPSNSHIKFDFLLPIPRLAYGWNNFAGTNFYTYILTEKDANLSLLKENLKKITEQSIFPHLAQQLAIEPKNLKKFFDVGNIFRYSLTPISQIHLGSRFSDELGPKGNREILNIILLLVSLVWTISCINYSNISLIQLNRNSKNTQIKKILGASKSNIFLQDLFDSLFLIFIGLCISLLLVWLLLPPVNSLLLKSYTLNSLFARNTALMIIGLFICTCIFCLAQPLTYLLKIFPVRHNKTDNNGLLDKNVFTKALIVFQFSVTVVFISCSFVIFQQLNFIQNKDLGYSKDQKIVIKNMDYLGSAKDYFKDRILNLNGVKSATIASDIPFDTEGMIGSFTYGSKDSPTIEAENWFIDQDYLSTLEIQILEGNGFSNNKEVNHRSVLINESMGKMLEKELIGKTLITDIDTFRIIGVVKDFNYSSFREKIRPLVFTYSESGNLSAVLIDQDKLAYLLPTIEKLWEEVSSNYPFAFHFMDDSYEKAYKQEKLLSNLTLIASYLSIAIASMGLFGLVSFSTHHKRKEISIRKILGASFTRIVSFILSNIMILSAISIFIGLPIAWWLSKAWLEGFSYRITLHPWIFINAGLLSFILTLVSCFLGVYKKVNENPANTLKELK